MEQLIQFFGRFHPLLVHLPIGILMVAVLFDWLSKLKHYQNISPSVKLLYLLGGLGAIFSCLTGYFLSQSGEYEGTTLQQHQWLGIATATGALGMYVYKTWTSKARYSLALSAGLMLLLTGAGHLGGSLTHGEDYLVAAMPEPFRSWLGAEKAKAPVVIKDVQEAIVYQDIVVPILKEKCYNCHNESKQKGKLRMDSPEFLAKGGKSKAVIIKAGLPQESELIRRLLLPKNDEKHMPPKEKPQLTEDEIQLLQWWIEQGADYQQPVKMLAQSESIRPILLGLTSANEVATEEVAIYPNVNLKAPDATAIAALQANRVVVLPIGQQENLLSVNFVNVEAIDDQQLALLEDLKEHIVWLKWSYSKVSDQQLAVVEKMTNLTKLYLNNTNITDECFKYLTNLPNLKYLNLVGTKVTAQGVQTLTQLPNLKQLYLYQTPITAQEGKTLMSQFPNTAIDTGGYRMPIVFADSMLVGE